MKEVKCAQCPIAKGKRICDKPGGDHPPFCPTINCPEAHAAAREIYQREDTLRFAQEATRQEKAAYAIDEDGVKSPLKPRIIETIEFCKRMGYKHLGLAFCGGLRQEAIIVAKILETNGFQVSSVMCKVACEDKSKLGLGPEDKMSQGHESMCNNIDQALILNEQGTEFNIMMGLCVGHDSLFLENSKARCTILAVKDRVTAHAPLQPIHLYDAYYAFLKKPLK